MGVYLRIVSKLSKDLESKSTYESDMTMLEETTGTGAKIEIEKTGDSTVYPEQKLSFNLSPNQKFAVVYRSQRKLILRGQIAIAKYLVNVIEESYQLKMLKSVGSKDIDAIYKKIYMQPMQDEDISSFPSTDS